MRNKRAFKYVLGLIIIGIAIFIIRTFHYSNLLGSLPDALWEMVFVIAIYDLTDRYIYTILPLILGVGIEVFQYLMQELNVNTIMYYPGYADIHDVIAYIIGYVLGVIFIWDLYSKRKGKVNKNTK